MATPVGAIYSTNITPDRETGIGDYSFEDFERAVRRGIAREGHTLYPAMPYPSYSRIREDDLRALYAYFMHGVEAVRQADRDSDIVWPLSMRWPLAMWRWMFAPEAGDFAPDESHDPVVARGAYLVEGLGHCGACHTPRGIGMQEKALRAGDGGLFLSGGGPIDAWVAKSLCGDHRTGIGRWSEEDLVSFMRTGRNPHSAVFGGMAEVVVRSLQYLDDADLSAIARYLKTLPASAADDKPYQYDDETSKRLLAGSDSQPGAALYVDNCAACHRTDGRGYATVFPALAGNAALNGSDATSLIHIALTGAQLPATLAAPSSLTMPSFGWRLNDRQMADVITFIRSAWGNSGTAVTAREVGSLREAILESGGDQGKEFISGTVPQP